MTERLDRIEANMERLIETVAATSQSVQGLRSEVESTTQSVQSLREEISEGFRQSREYADSAFGALVEAMDRRDADYEERQRRLDTKLEAQAESVNAFIEESRASRKETKTLVQNLIDDGKADRKANADEHQAFREQFQQLLTQLVTRINDIWDRLTG